MQFLNPTYAIESEYVSSFITILNYEELVSSLF